MKTEISIIYTFLNYMYEWKYKPPILYMLLILSFYKFTITRNINFQSKMLHKLRFLNNLFNRFDVFCSPQNDAQDIRSVFCASWADAMRAHTDVPDVTASRNTVRYVYGICVTWLINSPSMARSSCATPEFRSGQTSGDLETFTSHVTYTSCDVDTLRATSSQRCHSCVTFVCWGWCRANLSLHLHRWTLEQQCARGEYIKTFLLLPPPLSSSSFLIPFIGYAICLYLFCDDVTSQ